MLREIKEGFVFAEDCSMNMTHLQSLPKDRVRALFGLEPAALGELLAAVLPPLLEKRHVQQEAKRPRRTESAPSAAGAGVNCSLTRRC